MKGELIPYSSPSTHVTVPRDRFEREVAQWLADNPYDPGVYHRRRNPYTNQYIRDEADYEAYVREHIYHKLCEELVVSQYSSSLSRQYDYQYRTEYHHRLRRVALSFLAILCAAVVLVSAYFRARNGDAYDSGYSAGQDYGYSVGYDEGQTDGYADGESDGYSDGYTDGYQNSTDGRIATGIVTTPTGPYSWMDPEATVYVSRSGHKIHLSPNCSGMLYYDEMTYIAACTAGYEHCGKCF